MTSGEQLMILDVEGKDIQGEGARLRARGPATLVELAGSVRVWAVGATAACDRYMLLRACSARLSSALPTGPAILVPPEYRPLRVPDRVSADASPRSSRSASMRLRH